MHCVPRILVGSSLPEEAKLLVVKEPIARLSGNVSYDFAVFHQFGCLIRKPNYVNRYESMKCRYPLINGSDLFRSLTRLESKMSPRAESGGID